MPSIIITCSYHLNHMQCAIPLKVMWLFPHISILAFKIFFPIFHMFTHVSVCFINVLVVSMVSCLLSLFGHLPIFGWIGFSDAIWLKFYPSFYCSFSFPRWIILSTNHYRFVYFTIHPLFLDELIFFFPFHSLSPCKTNIFWLFF